MKRSLLAIAIASLFATGVASADVLYDNTAAASGAEVSSSSVSNTGGSPSFFGISAVSGTSSQGTQVGAANQSQAYTNTIDNGQVGAYITWPAGSFPIPGVINTVNQQQDQVNTGAQSVGSTYSNSQSVITGTVVPTSFFYPLYNVTGGSASQGGSASAEGALN